MKLEYWTRFFCTLALLLGVWNDLHSPWLMVCLSLNTVAIELLVYQAKKPAPSPREGESE